MSTQRFDLPVEVRSCGKHSSRTLRKNKRVPAVIYGAVKNKNVSLDEKIISKYSGSAYDNALFKVSSLDSEINNIMVMLKEVTVHPVSRRPEHVDLFALDLNKTVRVYVEIHFEGKAAGLADGGLMSIIQRQVEIECLPTEIPEFFTVDVSSLGLGDALHVADLKLPKGIKLVTNPEMTLAVVNLVKEESLTPTAAAEGAGAAAVPEASAGGAAAPASSASGTSSPASAAAKDAKDKDKSKDKK